MHRKLIAAAIIAATVPMSALAADDAASIAALKAIAANPNAPAPADLSDYGFTDATYLMDGLSQNELDRLRVHLDRRSIKLPSNIEGAIVARSQRPAGAKAGGPG